MGILEQILAAQEKTNTILEALAAGGVISGGAKADDGKKDAGKKPAGGKGKKDDAPVKPKHTKDEVVAAVVAVKNAFGAPVAKEITASFGLAKVAEAKEDQFDAIFDACEAKLQEADAAAEEEEEV